MVWPIRGPALAHSGRLIFISSSMEEEEYKKLIVLGDRVLVIPEEGEERTRVGLYLPATAVDHQAVRSGRIVATGPGIPLSEPASLSDEPWKISDGGSKYVPMQAEEGDYALFFRKAAVEITFKGKGYLVVPQAAILVLIRPDDPLDELDNTLKP